MIDGVCTQVPHIVKERKEKIVFGVPRRGPGRLILLAPGPCLRHSRHLLPQMPASKPFTFLRTRERRRDRAWWGLAGLGGLGGSTGRA